MLAHYVFFWYSFFNDKERNNPERLLTMKMTNLSICGSEKHYVSESALDVAHLPASTRSYTPIRHRDFVDRVKLELSQQGVAILNEVHSLARKGLRYFGLMQVQPLGLSSEDMGFIVGLRNSYDKSVPAAIACGNQVFICDNLMFSGEIVVGRRHTTNLFRDLPDKIREAVLGIMKRWEGQISRMAAYREIGLVNSEAHDLIAQAFLKGAVSNKQVADVISEWHQPRHAEFHDRNVFALHNAFTEVWKQNTPDIVLANSKVLHPILDVVCSSNAVIAPEFTI